MLTSQALCLLIDGYIDFIDVTSIWEKIWRQLHDTNWAWTLYYDKCMNIWASDKSTKKSDMSTYPTLYDKRRQIHSTIRLNKSICIIYDIITWHLNNFCVSISTMELSFTFILPDCFSISNAELQFPILNSKFAFFPYKIQLVYKTCMQYSVFHVCIV